MSIHSFEWFEPENNFIKYVASSSKVSIWFCLFGFLVIFYLVWTMKNIKNMVSTMAPKVIGGLASVAKCGKKVFLWGNLWKILGIFIF